MCSACIRPREPGLHACSCSPRPPLCPLGFANVWFSSAPPYLPVASALHMGGLAGKAPRSVSLSGSTPRPLVASAHTHAPQATALRRVEPAYARRRGTESFPRARHNVQHVTARGIVHARRWSQRCASASALRRAHPSRILVPLIHLLAPTHLVSLLVLPTYQPVAPFSSRPPWRGRTSSRSSGIWILHGMSAISVLVLVNRPPLPASDSKTMGSTAQRHGQRAWVYYNIQIAVWKKVTCIGSAFAGDRHRTHAAACGL